MAAKPKSEVPVNVGIPKPNIKTVQFVVKGTRPLIYHKWQEKAKKQIRDKQQKKVKSKDIRDSEQEYLDSFYYDASGNIAFPAINIKNSMVGATRFIDDIPMTVVRGAIFVRGDVDGMIPVRYKEKIKREDMVRVMRGGADLRYRGQLNDWEMTIQVEFNANVFSADMVTNLLLTAGFSQGLGEWRPEKNGDYGTFEIV